MKTNMEDAHDSSRLGNCEVCNSENALYTCPRCELKTCSLSCVNIHKKELDCSGERDKTGYVPLSKFSNLTLLSDYRFLEDVSRTIDSCKRNPLKKYTRIKRPLPPHLWRLRNVASKRRITLHFLPQHFTRHRENTTQLNFKSGVIFWKVEFVFPQGDNIKIVMEKCSEEDRLSLILSKLIEPEKCPDIYRNHLKFYHSCGLAGVEVLLKAENVKDSDSFFLLDTSLTLKDNFENRIIIENPIMHVILRDHKYGYNILDTDLDMVNNSDFSNSALNCDFVPFHYFDAVSYTNEKLTKSDAAVKSIKSSVAELKKYFSAGDSDMSDEDLGVSENPTVKTVKHRKKFNLPSYDELVKQ